MKLDMENTQSGNSGGKGSAPGVEGSFPLDLLVQESSLVASWLRQERTRLGLLFISHFEPPFRIYFSLYSRVSAGTNCAKQKSHDDLSILWKA